MQTKATELHLKVDFYLQQKEALEKHSGHCSKFGIKIAKSVLEDLYYEILLDIDKIESSNIH